MPVEPVKNAEGLIAIRRAPAQSIEWVDAAKLKEIPKDQRVNTSERFEQGRTFPNKLWNAARFVLMNLEGYEPAPILDGDLFIEDRWILGLLNQTNGEVTADLGAFRFADATRRLRDFTWNDFCDWYVEFLKGRLRDETTRPVAQRILATLLDQLCRLLHPIMPFVTEQIWQALAEIAPSRGLPNPMPSAESICIARWPEHRATQEDTESAVTVSQWQEKITSIRNLRAERNIPPSAKINPIIVASGRVASMLRQGEAIIMSMTNSLSLKIVDKADRPSESASAVLSDAEVILPLEGLIDKKEEAAKLKKQVGDLDKQIAAIAAKLGNDGFVSRAPAEVVEAQKAKLTELTGQRLVVAALLESRGN